ncbi:hypothetical protein PSm6_44390 [Pseudomonas solani]|uniref:Uncharacterized protein n=1 Tax=Pseudomonas solani TaxID=2731552 RepID=A0ABM7LEN9_9PSED|nr:MULTISPECIES: hypothetical protein [Pseudomonas]BCD88032.1 hypothetical protein PSm6_44390 [Pseudomonas solani]
MTRYQRARRFVIWRGALAALALFTGLLVVISLGGEITAEQPATAYTRQR